jgi:hypothetical protein
MPEVLQENGVGETRQQVRSVHLLPGKTGPLDVSDPVGGSVLGQATR